MHHNQYLPVLVHEVNEIVDCDFLVIIILKIATSKNAFALLSS